MCTAALASFEMQQNRENLKRILHFSFEGVSHSTAYPTGVDIFECRFKLKAQSSKISFATFQ